MEKIFQNVKKKSWSWLPVLAVLYIITSLLMVSAAKTLPQSEESKICHPARVDGYVANNIECNISVEFSNGTTLIPFQAMDDLGDKFCLNLSTSDTQIRGLYKYSVTCTNGSLSKTKDFDYLVNLGGIEPSPERTNAFNRSLFLFFGLSLVFFIAFIRAKTFPLKATFFLLMFWLALMGVNAMYISIQDDVINTNVESFFSFFLTVSYIANYAVFFSIAIIWLITLIVSTIERRKVNLLREYG